MKANKHFSLRFINRFLLVIFYLAFSTNKKRYHGYRCHNKDIGTLDMSSKNWLATYVNLTILSIRSIQLLQSLKTVITAITVVAFVTPNYLLKLITAAMFTVVAGRRILVIYS